MSRGLFNQIITMKTQVSLAIIACASISAASTACFAGHTPPAAEPTEIASEKPEISSDEKPVILTLTEEDYREVAEELGVETAAIKAIVEIEAGHTHQGFSAPGVPIVNFDLTMFRRFAGKNGINLSKYYKSHPQVFNRGQRGSQEAVNRRLKAARNIDNKTAIEGTFWGMFQIGGFNWKKCGAESIEDFVERMSRSERDQLELFANFIRNSGLLPSLQKKNWSTFARGYNGPSYARRGYHTRMASSYARHKKLEAQAANKAASTEKPKRK